MSDASGSNPPAGEHQSLPPDDFEADKGPPKDQKPQGPSQESYDKMLDTNRTMMARLVGLDPDNKLHAAVIEKEWTPEISLEDFQEKLSDYGIDSDNSGASSPPSNEPPVDDGPSRLANERKFLNADSAPADLPHMPDADDAARQTYANMIEKKTSTEDARVAALDTLLTTHGNKHVLDRMRARREEERRAAALQAEYLQR